MTRDIDNITELIARLHESKKKRFVLQLPEGLKTKAVEIISALENEGFEVIYAADPSYGACDLALNEARTAKADALVHIGHSKFYIDIQSDIPVIYFPWKIGINFEGMDVSSIKEQTIGIVTSIQHRDVMEDAKKFLESNKKKAILGGQILGCWDLSARNIEKDVDAFLFIGSGHFHPLALKTEKPVYVMNIELGLIEKLDTAIFEKKRWAAIYNAKSAVTFGILVSTKEGQNELLGRANEIKRKIEDNQKKAVILIMDEITDEKLAGIRVDAFINTACPRLADMHFSKPMINAGDLDEVLLG